MPCYDDTPDRENAIERNAMTAILCGVMDSEPRALSFAYQWHQHHKEIDRRRKLVKWDHEDPEIRKMRDNCFAVLKAAHDALCK